jgi:hypothetical protein
MASLFAQPYISPPD